MKINKTIECPVCGEVLFMSDPASIIKHMFIDEEHKKHLEQAQLESTIMRTKIDQIFPRGLMPN